jgi:hypothetical protein
VAVLLTRGCSRCDVSPNRVEAFDERAACQREALMTRLSVLRKSCSVIQEGEEVSRVEATVLRRQRGGDGGGGVDDRGVRWWHCPSEKSGCEDVND